MNKDILFSPLDINRMIVPNRVLMPAMHLNMTESSYIGDRIVAFYAERARGGVGAIIAGYASVNDDACSPGGIGAHKDEFMKGLSRLREVMQSGGGKAGLQLNHPGRNIPSLFLNGRQAVAPSAIMSSLTREVPRALKKKEIEAIVQDFADTAIRAKKTGFDFVEILSGGGYLISQFLSELTNQRTDEYGGAWENRMRFGLEVASAVREAVGKDYPVLWRVNGNDLMPNGIGRNRLKEFTAAVVEKGGADAISVNVGWHETRVPQIVMEVPRGAYSYLSKGIKECVNVPVIAGHRINDPERARQLIGDNTCDMVAMARPLIADPEFLKKTAEGREHEIMHCIACCQGCLDHLFNGKVIECMCNPRAGHELENDTQKQIKPKKILVCGGGPAGMYAASEAARQGHEAILYEKSDSLGGQLLIAGKPSGREEFLTLAEDLRTQVHVSGVKVVLGTAVDESVLEREKPDTVILATGAVEIAPVLPGADSPKVVSAWDVLAGKTQTGKNVVIIGGGAVGVETALFLANKGTLSGDDLKFLLVNRAEPVDDLFELSSIGTKKIVLIEMLAKIGADIGASTRWGMMQDLNRHRVSIAVGTKAKEITSMGVIVETGQTQREIRADTIVLALGSRSFNPLEDLVGRKGITFKVIGDAKRIAKAFDAIHSAYNIVREI